MHSYTEKNYHIIYDSSVLIHRYKIIFLKNITLFVFIISRDTHNIYDVLLIYNIPVWYSYNNSYEKNYHMYFACVSYKNIFTYNTYINTNLSIYIIYILYTNWLYITPKLQWWYSFKHRCIALINSNSTFNHFTNNFWSWQHFTHSTCTLSH